MRAGEGTIPTPSADGTFMGHPRLLWMLLAVTVGVNFGFYGFRAFLAPYAADTFFASLPHDQALAQANFLFAGFGVLVYATAILGGWVADNVLGEVRSLRLALWLQVAGIACMAVPSLEFFRLAIALYVLAGGLGIPLTVLIGRNYATEDPKREAGYTLFYLAINFAGFFAPLIAGTWIGTHYGFRWGFIAAAVGALFAALLFEWRHHRVPGARDQVRFERWWSVPLVVLVILALLIPCAWLLTHPDAMHGFVYVLFAALLIYFIVKSRRRRDRVQDHRYLALLLLFIALVVFWTLSNLSATALNFFARDHVAPLWSGAVFGIPWSFLNFQSVNPLYILILAIPVAMLWPWLDRHGVNPSTPRKFGIGLLLIGLGYAVLWYATGHLQLAGGKVAAWTLLAYYLGSTVGELALSPIGYGLIGKLAAPEENSLAMGGWFFGVSISYDLMGQVAAFTTRGGIEAYQRVFGWLTIIGLAAALAYLIAAPWILKLMHGVK
ncbi:MAG: hypothetical protein EPN38_12200 [Rhodanobacteraceae bacterium]|nr:MAG: hypothetical protein EPN38_12200 [Rhodanobacteraceae bacterium]